MNKKLFKRYIFVVSISIFIFAILFIVGFFHKCSGEDCIVCSVLGFLNAFVTIFCLVFNLSFIVYNFYYLFEFLKPETEIELKKIHVRYIVLKNIVTRVRQDLVFLKIKFQ